MSIIIRILLLGSAAVAFSTQSGAVLKLNEVAGERKVEHPVPKAATPEVCVVPKHFSLGRYAGKDVEPRAQHVTVHPGRRGLVRGPNGICSDTGIGTRLADLERQPETRRSL